MIKRNYLLKVLFACFMVLPAVVKAQVIIEQAPAEVFENGETKSVYDRHFKVGLFLPFFKDGADTTAVKHAFALSSLDYLAGVKAAIDSIEKTSNVVIDFYVEDTELDSSIVENLLHEDVYRDLDVLIGPAFQSGVEMALPIIQKRNTIMYLPFEKEYKFANFSGIISCQKNTPSVSSYLSSYFLRKFGDSEKEYVLLYNSREKYGKEARIMDSLIVLGLAERIDTSRIKIFDLAKKENASFAARLDKSRSHVFLVNTRNGIYANEALNQIKAIKPADPEVYCFFDILESELPAYETWDTLHVKFFSRFFVNYEDEKTGALRKKLIESYNEDPVEFTYKGYNDIIFLAWAFEEGKHWLKSALNREFPNEVSGFYYCKDPSNNGIFNGYQAVWRYEKLKVYRID
jgi:hypothetical protein